MDLKALSSKEQKSFQDLIRGYSYSTLMNWIKRVEIRDMVLEKKKKKYNNSTAAQNNMNNNDKAQLKRFLKQKASELLAEEDIQELEKIIERSLIEDESLENEIINIEKEVLKSYTIADEILKYEFDIKIEKVAINIKESEMIQKNCFSLLLTLQNLDTSLTFSDKFIRIKNNLKDCRIDYNNLTEFNSKNPNKMETLCRIEHQQENDSFIQISYEIPLTIMQGLSKINIEINSILFYYNPWVLLKIKDMFLFKETEEKAKVLAWNQFEKFSDSSKVLTLHKNSC